MIMDGLCCLIVAHPRGAESHAVITSILLPSYVRPATGVGKGLGEAILDTTIGVQVD